MKRTFKSIALIAITILATSSLFAQTTEAVIQYDVKMDSDDAQVKQQLSMMSGSTMTMMFKDDNFKQIMDMGMQKTTTIVNGKTDKSLMLMDMMGMKMAIPMEQPKDEEGAVKPEVDVTGETKEILGYKCKEVIITSEDESEIIVYVTEEIAPKNNKSNYGSSVKGFALQIEVEQPMFNMIMTATNIEKKVKDKKAFDTKIPDGYEEKTMEDLKAMGGGM